MILRGTHALVIESKLRRSRPLSPGSGRTSSCSPSGGGPRRRPNASAPAAAGRTRLRGTPSPAPPPVTTIRMADEPPDGPGGAFGCPAPLFQSGAQPCPCTANPAAMSLARTPSSIGGWSAPSLTWWPTPAARSWSGVRVTASSPDRWRSLTSLWKPWRSTAGRLSGFREGGCTRLHRRGRHPAARPSARHVGHRQQRPVSHHHPRPAATPGPARLADGRPDHPVGSGPQASRYRRRYAADRAVVALVRFHSSAAQSHRTPLPPDLRSTGGSSPSVAGRCRSSPTTGRNTSPGYAGSSTAGAEGSSNCCGRLAAFQPPPLRHGAGGTGLRDGHCRAT